MNDTKKTQVLVQKIPIKRYWDIKRAAADRHMGSNDMYLKIIEAGAKRLKIPLTELDN